jgi:transcriptional regulator with GAF, ATPase, and Fis domain
VFPILIPSLKNRKQDILSLTNYFIGKKSKEMGITKHLILAADSMNRLLSYDWPGNVRELENAVERALILQKGGVVDFSDIISPSLQKTEEEIPNTSESKTMNHILIKEISNVLRLTNGKIEGKNGAAQRLGIKPNTLRYRMRKLGIPFGRNASCI